MGLSMLGLEISDPNQLHKSIVTLGKYDQEQDQLTNI